MCISAVCSLAVVAVSRMHELCVCTVSRVVVVARSLGGVWVLGVGVFVLGLGLRVSGFTL